MRMYPFLFPKVKLKVPSEFWMFFMGNQIIDLSYSCFAMLNVMSDFQILQNAWYHIVLSAGLDAWAGYFKYRDKNPLCPRNHFTTISKRYFILPHLWPIAMYAPLWSRTRMSRCISVFYIPPTLPGLAKHYIEVTRGKYLWKVQYVIIFTDKMKSLSFNVNVIQRIFENSIRNCPTNYKIYFLNKGKTSSVK